MKRFFMLLFAMVMIPYVTTLAWTGRIRTDVGESIPTEEFLVGMVAAEIPAEYGIETMKAQAVLARTYVYRIVDPGIGGENTDDPGSADPGTDSGAGAAGWGKRSRTLDRDLMEEELDIDCLSVREMEKKWGNEHFEEYYEKVRRAVRETEGLVAEYDGELIEPFYCLASTGKRVCGQDRADRRTAAGCGRDRGEDPDHRAGQRRICKKGADRKYGLYGR